MIYIVSYKSSFCFLLVQVVVFCKISIGQSESHMSRGANQRSRQLLLRYVSWYD